MDDDSRGLVGVEDQIKSWHIRAIATEAIEMAVKSAKRDGETVGEYLEKLIRRDLTEVQGRRQAVVAAVTTSGAHQFERQPGSDLDDLSRLIELAIWVSPEGKDTGPMRLARRAVKERLEAMATVKNRDRPGDDTQK